MTSSPSPATFEGTAFFEKPANQIRLVPHTAETCVHSHIGCGPACQPGISYKLEQKQEKMLFICLHYCYVYLSFIVVTVVYVTHNNMQWIAHQAAYAAIECASVMAISVCCN